MARCPYDPPEHSSHVTSKLSRFCRCSDRIRTHPLQEAEGQQVRGAQPVCRVPQGHGCRPEGAAATAAATTAAATTAATAKLPTGRTDFKHFFATATTTAGIHKG